MRNKKYSSGIRSFILILLLFLLFPAGVYAAEYPDPTPVFYVNDFGNVIEPETEAAIEAASARLEQLTSAQVVVVTMDDIGENNLEEYTLGLFREWGIGNKEEDNGVLIFLSLDGHTRIDVGYGLEGILPDGKTGRIQDELMLTDYNQGEFSQGILNGFNAIVNEVYKEYGLEDEYIGSGPIAEEQHTNEQAEEEQSIPPFMIIIGLIAIIPLIILDFKLTGGMFTFMILRSIGRGRGGGGGGRSGGGGSAGGGGSSRGF
ncbi:MAG: TPM domain-containing protein [Eubacteriales bacterium]